MHYTYEAELRAMCESKGAVLRFLAPYCPQDNPIEKGFFNFKSWLRRHNEWATANPEYDVIALGLRQCVSPDTAANLYLQSCGYSIRPDLR